MPQQHLSGHYEDDARGVLSGAGRCARLLGLECHRRGCWLTDSVYGGAYSLAPNKHI
jgi:hypothetical protein